MNVGFGADADDSGAGVSVVDMNMVRSGVAGAGTGVGNALPVIAAALLSEPGGLLVFEHPGQCPHPYSQCRLADLFVECCRHGRRVIVETHSESSLLRLRLKVVRNRTAKEAVAISFFSNSNGARAEAAPVSDFGNFRYPGEYRDETRELENEFLRAAVEKKGLTG